MDGWIWVLVGIAVVAAFAVLFVLVSRRPNLEEQFGPEYERALDRADSEREGKRDLRDRLKQHRKLELRPLSPDAARGYAERWFVIQSGFVDEPAATCRKAGDLLDEVLRERGYPVDEDFDTQADLVSVDHPDLVSDYRTAHEATTRGVDGGSGTEDLRIAFVAYRNLFSELLDEQADGDHEDDDIDLTDDDASYDDRVTAQDAPDEEDVDVQSPRA